MACVVGKAFLGLAYLINWKDVCVTKGEFIILRYLCQRRGIYKLNGRIELDTIQLSKVNNNGRYFIEYFIIEYSILFRIHIIYSLNQSVNLGCLNNIVCYFSLHYTW